MLLMHTALLPEDKREPSVAASSKERVLKMLGQYEKQLGDGRTWITGSVFTAADIMQVRTHARGGASCIL